jgi:phage minor structural protein
LINFHVDNRLFQSEILYFDIPIDDPRADTVAIDERLQYDIGEYYITNIEDEITEEGFPVKRVTAEVSWMRLTDRKKVGTFELDHTPEAGLALILEGTGWSVGVASGDPTTFVISETDKTVLELIWMWAKITGNEINFNSVNHTVDIVSEVGLDLGLSFRYGKNLQQIKRTVTPPTATRIYPFGKNGLSVAALTSGGAPYVEDYSYYIAQGLTEEEARAGYQKDEVVNDESFVEDIPLYNMGIARLAVTSQPGIVYSAKVIDLNTLVHYDEGGFLPGDTVWVEAEPLSISERARVSRRDFYPYEPSRDVVELSFNPILIPDVNTSTARSDTSRNWELFVSCNLNTPRFVWQGSQIINRIKLRTTTDAEWVVGYTLKGVAVGSSTVTIEFTDSETGLPWWTTKTLSLTNGQEVDLSLNWGKKEIPAGTTTLIVRMYSNSVSNGLNIAADRSNLWVLARGTTRQNVTLPNSIRFDFTGAVQHWTAPDDVSEYQIETHGAGPNGLGAMLRAMHNIIPGSDWDIYVGGAPGSPGAGVLGGGWPNGGDSAGPFASQQGGGGSTDVRPAGTAYTSTIQLAGAGGGHGEGSASNPSPYGGQGGYLVGGNSQHGAGATQSAGGSGASAGTDGTANQGGAAFWDGNFFSFGGGGGGGGWFGGEGGQGVGSPSQSGGGGGTSAASTACWDLETQDGENSGHGYVIISWEEPVEV